MSLSLKERIVELRNLILRKADRSEIPIKLPNPKKLIIRGTHDSIYDGSEEVTIDMSMPYDDSELRKSIQDNSDEIKRKYSKPETGIPKTDIAEGVIPQPLSADDIKSFGFAMKSDIPKNTSELTNDSGYLTRHQSLDAYRTLSEQDSIDDVLRQKIDQIESGKFPNAVIVGEPLIVGNNVSRFSIHDYMIFPFIVDIRGKTFSIEFCFHTGSDVVNQQNVLDSKFGLALAVKDGHGLIALSSNGLSWNIGVATGTMVIEPDSVYYARLNWNGVVYTAEISIDGETYIEDMRIVSSDVLHPETIYIGGEPDLFGTGSAHPWGGGIDMSNCRLTVAGIEVWHGMDDPGLASRANVSLSNLDAIGERRFNELNENLSKLKIGRVTTLCGTELSDGVAFDTVGSPEYIDTAKMEQYAQYGVTEPGWYIFARIHARNNIVTSDFSITGTAGYIAPPIGADCVDVAIRFGVTAESQLVTVNWGQHTESFVFKSTDLAARNLDYRVTFYLYDIKDYCEWEYVLATDDKFVKGKSYYKLVDGEYVAQDVTVDEDIPANAYYVHKSLTIKGFVRNMSYTLDTTVDCPVTIHLPEAGGDNYGAWFEVQMNFLQTYSVTIVPHDGQKVSANGVHSPKVGINIINILYHKPTNTWLPTVTNWAVATAT